MRFCLLLVLLAGCDSKPTTKVKVLTPVETYLNSIYNGQQIEYKNVKLWYRWDISYHEPPERKERIYLRYFDERVADIRLRTVEQRETLRIKLAAVDGVIKAVILQRSEFILFISGENWYAQKEKIFDLLTE